jgi:flagellar P-ring protein FlgI
MADMTNKYTVIQKLMRGAALGLVLCLVLCPAAASALSRVKDIAAIQGVRDNQLIGYGLVVGLDGTGDSRQTFFTTQTLANLLNREGINIPARSIQISNTAAVMVTATLPPFARTGGKIDVTVSSIGDADSLQGGVLLMTPLRAANGEVFAVAQGAVSIGGFAVRAATASVQKNHPTVGRIPEGALIEREVNFSLQAREFLTLVLHQGDFTTASRVASAVNQGMGRELAHPLDSRTVQVAVPPDYRPRVVEFIAAIENQTLQVDRVAKVILNERTGTVIFGKEVRIAAVTIVHGSLSVQIGTQFIVSQPEPFGRGDTVVVPVQTVEIGEEPANRVVVPEGASIDEVVRALTAVGATPRDVLAIIQAIRAAGALNAELEII